MRELLEKLLLPGVHFAALIHLDGYRLESVAQTPGPAAEIRADDLSVLAAALCGAAQAVGGQFPSGGNAEEMHLHETGAALHFYWLNAQHVLILRSTPDFSDETARVFLQAIKPALLDALAHATGTEIIRFGDDIQLSDFSKITFD